MPHQNPGIEHNMILIKDLEKMKSKIYAFGKNSFG